MARVTAPRSGWLSAEAMVKMTAWRMEWNSARSSAQMTVPGLARKTVGARELVTQLGD